MIFTTWTFGLYFWSVLALYWAIPARRRVGFLLVASILCYAWSIPIYALIISALSGITFGLAQAIAYNDNHPNRYKKLSLIVGLTASIFTLCFFKYLKLAVVTINSLFSSINIHQSYPLPAIIAPLGISFFTFEFIHYLTDLYHGRIDKQDGFNWKEFGLFTFFFPTMVSGPIKRYQLFTANKEEREKLDGDMFAAGFARVIAGLFKKIVIADTATRFIDPLSRPWMANRYSMMLAIASYSVKIYYDFGGYSDIAIGSAAMLGYRVPENFNSPYLSTNISDFWRRWHMSLSSWIRDYLFIPLGGNRVSKLRAMFNLTFVMAICGLWHGANLTFIIWGLWHGAGLVILQLWRKTALPDNKFTRMASWVITLIFVSVGWILFAAPNMQIAIQDFRML